MKAKGHEDIAIKGGLGYELEYIMYQSNDVATLCNCTLFKFHCTPLIKDYKIYIPPTT